MKPATLFALVGMRHRGTEGLVAAMPNGEPLELRREPDNPFDGKAVMVWGRGQHLGYIKSSANLPLATALDQGVRFSARLHRSDPSRWPLVEVEGVR